LHGLGPGRLGVACRGVHPFQIAGGRGEQKRRTGQDAVGKGPYQTPRAAPSRTGVIAVGRIGGVARIRRIGRLGEWLFAIGVATLGVAVVDGF